MEPESAMKRGRPATRRSRTFPATAAPRAEPFAATVTSALRALQWLVAAPPPLNLPALLRRIRVRVQPRETPIAATRPTHNTLPAREIATALPARARSSQGVPLRLRLREHPLAVRLVVAAAPRTRCLDVPVVPLPITEASRAARRAERRCHPLPRLERGAAFCAAVIPPRLGENRLEVPVIHRSPC
jgi:hypothetical protein